MDGVGSIQVNHLCGASRNNLQYRLVIKLPNLKANYNMLVQIAKVLGGTVRTGSENEDVLWVVDDKEKIKEIIKIYDTYPPITSRKICQLAFLKECLAGTTMEAYFLSRGLKYNKQAEIIKSNTDFTPPSYFRGWLSGFIESGGCFSLRQKANHSFSIGQNDDSYIINAIKQQFGACNMVRNPYGKFYSIEVYKKEVLLDVIKHCSEHPLLGAKLVSLNKFKKKLRFLNMK